MDMVSRAVALMSLTAVLAGAESRVPVVVELFTSEGCSSCPPADRVLRDLAQQPIPGAMVIALSEHVDYWDHLGWRDPYSSPLFSARQQAYGEVFQAESVYTPQMIVDGLANFNGSEGGVARDAIKQAARQPKAAVSIEPAGGSRDDRVAVRVERLGAAKVEQADVFLAIAEDGLSTTVTAGENGGRNLSHAGVVRSLIKIAEIEAKRGAYTAELALVLHPSWRRERTRAVLFVQDRRTRRIAGAATCAVAVRD
jgi:hypothetical protein